MATSNTTDEIKLQNLKLEESTTPKPKEGATASGVSKEKTAKPKKDKPKQEKGKPQAAAAAAAAAAVVEAPPEELDFNRTPEEVAKSLEQWTKTPATSNQRKSDEKM